MTVHKFPKGDNPSSTGRGIGPAQAPRRKVVDLSDYRNKVMRTASRSWHHVAREKVAALPYDYVKLSTFFLASVALSIYYDEFQNISRIPYFAILALAVFCLATLYHHLFYRTFILLHCGVGATIGGAFLLPFLVEPAWTFAAVVGANITMNFFGWFR